MTTEAQQPPIVNPLGTDQIRKALYAAQRAVGAIAKDSEAKVKGESKRTGKEFEYSYAFTSSEDMLEHCRKVLHENGLSWEMVSYDVATPLPGMQCPTLWGDFELFHESSGQVLTRRYPMPIASKNDPDKALSGAITYLLGQSTRLLLLVPKLSEADVKNTPDNRESHHGGWDDHDKRGTERVVTPANGSKPPAPKATDAERRSNDIEIRRAELATNSEELKRLCQAASTKVQRYTHKSPGDLREAAKLPATGPLDPMQLCKYLHSLRATLALHETLDDELPDWAGSQRDFNDEIDNPSQRVGGRA